MTAGKGRNTAVPFPFYGFVNQGFVSDAVTFVSVSCWHCVGVGCMDFEFSGPSALAEWFRVFRSILTSGLGCMV